MEGRFNIHRPVTDWSFPMGGGSDSARPPPASTALASVGRIG